MMPAVLSRFLSFLFVALPFVLVSPPLCAAEGWTNADGHPIVPGFERFYTDAGADPIKGGRLLLGELNCTSCHQAEAAMPRKQAPILDGVGSRLRRSYLRKFLRDPKAIKPGTTMPNLFAAAPKAESNHQIEALVHFLASTGTLQQARPDRKSIALGKQLYHQVGCVACHGSRDAKGNAAKLLSTSVPLGDLRSKYSIASLAAFLGNPLAVRPSGRMPGILSNEEAKLVANYLLQGQSLAEAPANLTYAYYEGSWDTLPDFATLKPVATGQVNGFDLSLAQRPNDCALRFAGYLRIDRSGNYRFHLTSDDGSKLVLDDKLAVANDGIHPPSTVSETVKLTKGTHKLTVGVFNGGGEFELHIEIEGPGLERQDVAPLVTLTPQGNPKPAVKPLNPEEDDGFALKPDLVEKGRELFASIGCASCHQLNNGGKAIASTRKAPALKQLRGMGGCLAAEPAKGLPYYSLNAVQRGALAAGLRSPIATKPTAEETIIQTMTTLNCYACHQRGKLGGIEDGISTYFTTTQPEMGAEGRLPPPLHDAGVKLRPDYLQHIFNQGAHDRPYMETHMPRFGASNVPGLIEALAAADKGKVESVAPVTFREPTSRIKSEARKMCGGNSLGCIKCHTFAGHRAEGVQGIDMLLMPRRLQDCDRAALPQGLRKDSIPLIPDKEAIVYRNFIEGSGARGIAVGYPEKTNLAFDANELRLALIWQGDFLDAARHWSDRSAGFEPPLGDNVIHLPTGVAFAVLDKDDQAWPNHSAKELGYQFRGYRTTPDGRPTFLYTCCGAQIEDFPNAVADKSSPSIRRVLTLMADKPVANLWFRAAVADKIETIAKGTYRINGEWTLKLDPEAKIRKSGGKMELLTPVRFHEGKAKIVQEFVW